MLEIYFQKIRFITENGKQSMKMFWKKVFLKNKGAATGAVLNEKVFFKITLLNVAK